MIERLISIFRCRHIRYSWPQTRNEQTYVACTDCGAELSYDMATMTQGQADKDGSDPLRMVRKADSVREDPPALQALPGPEKKGKNVSYEQVSIPARISRTNYTSKYREVAGALKALPDGQALVLCRSATVVTRTSAATMLRKIGLRVSTQLSNGVLTIWENRK